MRASHHLLTLEEFLLLPETKPASEYREGRITQKPMPLGRHSRLQTMLAAWLVPRLGDAADVFVELRCTFGERSIVPDLAVVARERIPRDPDGRIANVFRFAPDIAIEVRSPGQSSAELIEKLEYCARHGSSLGLLVDPESETIDVVRPDRPTERLQADGMVDWGAVAAGATLAAREVFGWLR